MCHVVSESVNSASYGHKFERNLSSAISSKRVTTLFVRLFIASEYSSFVRVVDWANYTFSPMKSHCSHFCFTKFYQTFPGRVFKESVLPFATLQRT